MSQIPPDPDEDTFAAWVLLAAFLAFLAFLAFGGRVAFHIVRGLFQP